MYGNPGDRSVPHEFGNCRPNSSDDRRHREFEALGEEFEMAYQSRVAIDRIRFAIRVTEQSADQPEQLREASYQLLDALDRLETAERNFQRRFRSSSRHGTSESADHRVNGTVAGGDRRKAVSRA
jgi:hypothetical protein